MAWRAPMLGSPASWRLTATASMMVDTKSGHKRREGGSDTDHGTATAGQSISDR